MARKDEREKKGPEIVEEGALDEASGGGIMLLLPAVQKVRDAAATSACEPQFTGGVFVAASDITR